MLTRVIALEEHFALPALDAVSLGGVKAELISQPVQRKLADLGAGRLADMDAVGIDVQVLSHTQPGVQALSGDEAIAVARTCNDQIAKAARTHPDRFRAFAMLPTSEPQAAAEELRRAHEELGLVGALINGTTAGRFLDDPFFQPLLAEAERLHAPLYLHPGEPTAAVRAAYFHGFRDEVSHWLATAGWGWHQETGLHVLRMILAGVFDRLPKLQVIIGHMGEMLPFMLARIDDWLPPAKTGLELSVADYLRRNVHITTSGVFTLPPFLCALATVGVERLLFSVDYPYSSNAAGRAFLDELAASRAVSADDLERIAHGNAEKLLGV